MEKTIKKPVEEKPTVGKADRRINVILSVVLGVLCVAWIYPIVMIFFNSLKTERAITTSRAFELPTAGTFVGLKNYIYGIQEMDFLSSFWYSLVITVSSVVLILLCCSMCAWFITRVNGKLSKLMYGLCMFSMVVPFQMVMFTLAKTVDTLKLNNPYNICTVCPGSGTVVILVSTITPSELRVMVSTPSLPRSSSSYTDSRPEMPITSFML